jgi:hypothetical protein
MQVHFSKHSIKRIAERTQLKPQDISTIIENGSYVSIGSIPGFNKEHLLFFSVADNDFFFIVRDYFTMSILTVLPVTYQRWLPRAITGEDLSLALNLATKEKTSPKERSIPKNEQDNELIKKIHIFIRYVSSRDGKAKSKSIVKVNSNEFLFSVENAVSSPEVKALVKEALNGLSDEIDKYYPIEFFVKNGNRSIPEIVSF